MLISLSLREREIYKADQNVIKVEVLEFVVGWYLKFPNEPKQLIFKLMLEKGALFKLRILNTAVILFLTPLSGKGKKLFVSEIEQDFVRYFSNFYGNFALNFEFLINKVENEIADLVDCNHAGGVRIILLPKSLKCF